MSGPLTGLKVVELAGIGPGPFAGMLLSDMGADVVTITRAGGGPDYLDAGKGDVLNRGRCRVELNLKDPQGIEALLLMLESADVLIEGFRPGVMERLGVGPDVCLTRNPALVYGRITGWGQTGPLAHAAGHDINYIALTGVLDACGPVEQPLPPLNLVGDFGGGGMLLAFGIACAVIETRQSGKGQIIDAAMTDGSALLMALSYGFHSVGNWDVGRDKNFAAGNSTPFYTTYLCADGKWVSIGSLEPQFYSLLLEQCDMQEEYASQWDADDFPARKQRFADVFSRKTREQWCDILEGTDVCFAPVLDMKEAPKHPHNVARDTFVEIDGVVQPTPAPRFSRTHAEINTQVASANDVLKKFGLAATAIKQILG